MYITLRIWLWDGVLVLNFLDVLPGFRDFSCLCMFRGLGVCCFLVLTGCFGMVHGLCFGVVWAFSVLRLLICIVPGIWGSLPLCVLCGVGAIQVFGALCLGFWFER